MGETHNSKPLPLGELYSDRFVHELALRALKYPTPSEEQEQLTRLAKDYSGNHPKIVATAILGPLGQQALFASVGSDVFRYNE